VSAHALLGVISGDPFAKETAANLIQLRCRQSALFLAQLPSLLDTTGIETLKEKTEPFDGPKGISEDIEQEQLDLIMDRIFRDSFEQQWGNEEQLRGREKKMRNVIDSLKLVRSSETNKKIKSALVRVAKESGMKMMSELICQPSLNDKTTFLSSEGKTSTLQCSALSAVAHLQLDALSSLVSKKSASANVPPSSSTEDDNAAPAPSPPPKDFEFDQSSYLIAPLSSNIHSALFADKEDRIHDVLFPRPGAIVSLVGKAAFPCVCEVSNDHAGFFTDDTACVIADGVKWQSMYLVLYSRYMLLAEPEKGGNGSNGRIITSCLVSNLSIEKDKSQYTSNLSTARRVLLRHSSPDTTPPGVFSLDDESNTTTTTNSASKKNTIHSSMDLWFEDKVAADRAYDGLLNRITKERSRRGKRLREALSRESHSRAKSEL